MSMSTDMWTYREDTVAPGDAPRNVVGYGVEAVLELAHVDLLLPPAHEAVL